MNKRALLLLSLSTTALTSCGLLTGGVWSWEVSTKNHTLKYCLLIGQIDHNDSMYRTRGTREALDTRVEKKYQKDNFNLEGTKVGHIKLNDPEYGYYDPEVPTQEFTVKELESMEQKSFSGATWDPITANGTTSAWISKHGRNITAFVSNNDGMAEGAVRAYNWNTGMPIFGYDANKTTLISIDNDMIMGTIDSNTVGQCLTTSVIIRNIFNASQPSSKYENKSLIQYMWDKYHTPYNPIYEGFQYDDSEYQVEFKKQPEVEKVDDIHSKISYGKGYVHSTVTFDGCLNDDLVNNPESHHAILLKNRSVTKDKYTEEIDPSAIKADYFFDDKGNTLSFNEIYAKAEGENVEKDKENIIKPDKQTTAVRLWQSWYSKTDTFFTGNMNPYFDITQGSNMFNFTVDRAEGDGSDEGINLNKLDAALARTERPNAFLINPVQQPNSIQYITKIATAYGLQEKDNWIDRSDMPIIFWNRQPTDRHGAISSKDIMNNKYFKYTYYIGFDAEQGGELQGNMVKAWLNRAYIENYKKGER